MDIQSIDSKRRALLALSAGAAAGWLLRPARAQEAYPNRPVRVVMPYTAGGAGDVVTRLIAQGLSTRLGQQFVVENRPGAGGATGAGLVAKAAPDGYTLAFAAVGYNLLPAMQPQLNFDPGKVLAPIGSICSQPYVLLIRADAPYRNLAELVAYAKAHPGDVRLAHAGVGTLIHLFGVWLAAEAHIQLNEIPYPGSAPALNSLLAGQTDVYFDPPSNSLPHLGPNAKIRAIAVTGTERLRALPEVKTLREQGYAVSGATWFGLMAPMGTPRPLIDRLNEALNATLDDPATRQKLEGMQYRVDRSTPDSFGTFFEEQTALFTKIIRDNKVKAQ